MATVRTITESIAPEFPAAYYKTQVLKELAKKYVFYQFAKKIPLPQGNGKTVQTRRAVSYTADLTPLVEGTPPTPLSPTVEEVLIAIQQYGDYTPISDLASFVAVDNLVALEIDKITRLQHEKVELLNIDALKPASHVVYAAANNTPATSTITLTAAHVLTSLELRKAQRDLKKRHADPVYRNGKPYYICVVNPDSTFELQNDSVWIDVAKYQAAEKIENGEIGKLFGFIVVESPFPIEWYGADLSVAARTLTVAANLQSAGPTITIDETITADDATALATRKILIGTELHTVVSADATAKTITTKANITTTAGADGVIIYPGEGGAAGVAIQGALCFGADAFGNVELEGARNIEVYANESGGPTDPLHQLRTVGLKINGFGAGIVTNDYITMIKHGVAA